MIQFVFNKRTAQLLLGACLLFCGYASKSQVSTGYVFASSSGTYTAITGGTVLGSGSTIDENTYPVSLPFTFSLNGTSFTDIYISDNGFITFGSTDPAGYQYFISSGPGGMFAAAPFSSDLIKVNASAEVRSQVIGTSPNRTFVVQWSNLKSVGGRGENYNFQVQLQESNSQIDFVYGGMTITSTDFTYGEVGLTGSTDYVNRTNTSDWNSSAGSTMYDAMYLSSSVYPSSGTTYSWVPAPPSSYLSSVVEQMNGDIIALKGTTNHSIIRIQIIRSDEAPVNVTSLSVSTAGTTNLADIKNMTVWYTGNSTAPDFYTPFGSTIAAPASTQTFTGTQALTFDTNYFWVTCDIDVNATSGNFIDFQSDSIIVSDTTRIPTVTNPTGNSLIGQSVYCSPSSGGYGYITNVQFNTLDNSPLLPDYANYFRIFVPTGTNTTTVSAGSTYTLSLTNTDNAMMFVWIDYDQNNVFDTYEWTQVTTSATPNVASTVSIIIPAATPSGSYSMRIRSSFGPANSSGNACSYFSGGESQDYTITINGTMPVTLLSFSAQTIHNKDVQLNWATAQEVTNKAFILERSVNQQDFAPVATVAGRGTTSSIQTYTFTDIDAFIQTGKSTVYYRLKQVDDNGQVEYSPVVPVNKNKTSQTDLTVYPNPFSSSATFTLSSAEEQQAVASILDLQGKILFTKTLTCAAGINTFMLENLSNLNNGIYFIQVQLEHEHVPAQIKLVKAE